MRLVPRFVKGSPEDRDPAREVRVDGPTTREFEPVLGAFAGAKFSSDTGFPSGGGQRHTRLSAITGNGLLVFAWCSANRGNAFACFANRRSRAAPVTSIA